MILLSAAVFMVHVVADQTKEKIQTENNPKRNRGNQKEGKKEYVVSMNSISTGLHLREQNQFVTEYQLPKHRKYFPNFRNPHFSINKHILFCFKHQKQG